MATEPLSARFNIAVSEDMKARVNALADRQDRREAEVVRAAVAAYLTKEESRGQQRLAVRR
jgi:predicted transcriptional regulator